AGAEIILGEATFADPHTLTVNSSALWGERIIIAAGSIPVVPKVPGVEATITSDEVMFLPVFPRRLVIVGAGVIGLEMAGAFSDFGAEVVIIGQEPEILPTFDPDVAGYVRKILENRGVTFHLGANLTSFSGRRGDVTAHFTKDGEPHEETADQACVAIGRRWRPETLGAERLGLERGHLGLAVSPYLRTSMTHIYAAGDAAGNAQLTPVAAYEGRLAAHNALQGDRLIADTTLRAAERVHDAGGRQDRLDPPGGDGQRREVSRRDTGYTGGFEWPRHRRGRRVSQARLRCRPGAPAWCADGQLCRCRAHPDGGARDPHRRHRGRPCVPARRPSEPLRAGPPD